jgi:hypothetical protein
VFLRIAVDKLPDWSDFWQLLSEAILPQKKVDSERKLRKLEGFDKDHAEQQTQAKLFFMSRLEISQIVNRR